MSKTLKEWDVREWYRGYFYLRPSGSKFKMQRRCLTKLLREQLNFEGNRGSCGVGCWQSWATWCWLWTGDECHQVNLDYLMSFFYYLLLLKLCCARSRGWSCPFNHVGPSVPPAGWICWHVNPWFEFIIWIFKYSWISSF